MPNSTQTAVWLVSKLQVAARDLLTLSALSGVLVVGMACGGSGAATPSQVEPPAASSGDEPPPAATPEPAPPTSTAASAGRQGILTVRAEVDGRNVNAHVRIDADGRTLEGATGESIGLAPGDHAVEVSITDTSVLADKPTQRLGVFVAAGQEAAAIATFPWAKVQLNLLVGGRSQPGVPIKLLRNGQVVAELKSGAPHQLISPGKYEADVLMRGTSIRVKGLVILESATQTVPVRAQF